MPTSDEDHPFLIPENLRSLNDLALRAPDDKTQVLAYTGGWHRPRTWSVWLHRAGTPEGGLDGAPPVEERGSIKDVTALALVFGRVLRKGRFDGETVVESTSGNLGVALARVCRSHADVLGRFEFVAVVDDRCPEWAVEEIRRLGCECRRIHPGGQAARIEAVARMVRTERFEWLDQYGNPDNPAAHRAITARRIHRNLIGPLLGPPRAVYCAVSTGGTYVGLRTAFDSDFPAANVDVIPVDVEGSQATGGEPGPRFVQGMGGDRPIGFGTIDRAGVRVVESGEAFAAVKALLDVRNVPIGGSGGAVLAAFLNHVDASREDLAVRNAIPSILVIADNDAESAMVAYRRNAHAMPGFDVAYRRYVDLLTPPPRPPHDDPFGA